MLDLKIAFSLHLLLCTSHHLTQLSDRFVTVLAALACQLALMLNIHNLFGFESCILGMRNAVERADRRLLTALVRNLKPFVNHFSAYLTWNNEILNSVKILYSRLNCNADCAEEFKHGNKKKNKLNETVSWETSV